MEILATIVIENSGLNPVEISILYNDDGSVNSIDWRESVLEPNPCGLETIEEEISDDDTVADPDYCPHYSCDSDSSADF